MTTPFNLKHAFLSIGLLLLFFQGSQAQTNPGTYRALLTFLSTDFFTEYLELRERAYESVHQFKMRESNYSEEDVEKIKASYEQSAAYFNKMLLNIKADLLNPQRRKYIVQFPQNYSKEVECDLRRAREFYENTYGQEVIRVTQGEVTGSAFLALVPDLIRYGKSAFEILQKIQSEIKKFNEKLLNEELINKYAFKSWDEIS
ncbi:MAG: hypothetical protein MRZ79_00085 [Bacteroidia bacterium]|nr:hypothetical protein [Bacteroidia bacterium]